MKLLSFLAAAVALSTLTSTAQLSQSSRLNDADAAPVNPSVTSRAVDSRAVENLLRAYDAGDSYIGTQGRRSLLRLSDAVAVRVTSGAALEALTVKGGVLDGYERGMMGKKGFVWLKSSAVEKAAQAKDPSLLARKIETTRQTEKGRTANPVFIEPASGLWAITTDEIIVTLKPGVDARDYFGAEWSRVKPLFEPLRQYILTLPQFESEAVFAEVTRRTGDPRVAWAEPNFISQGLTHLLPNDPQFVNQWHLRNTGQSGGTSLADIKAAAAWDRTVGSSSIIVAVLDIGFDLAHPDLIANVATNAQEIAGNGIDDDSNGYVDDVRGWDFFGSDNNASPNTAFDNHGTPVAGAAVATGDNGVGIAGVAYGCRLLPLRMGEATTTGSFSSRDSDIANALYYAAGGANQADSWRGADVIVMSFESFQTAVVDSALTFATEQGRGGRGCPAFVAMGNHGDNWISYTLNGFPAGTFTFEWKYAKNGSGAGGEDAVWLAQVMFPGGGTERFDGAIFPPSSWTTSGNANWTRATDPAHAYGSSLFTARSGVIGDNQSSSLLTTRTLGSGSLTYLFWVSSEAGADIFSISVNGGLQAPANQSGAPFIRPGPSYPGTHTNIITVGASSHWDTRATYSQIGGKLDFLAPGGGGGGSSIQTTDRTGTSGDNTAASPAGDYLGSQGTSLANPIAAGVGALMLSVAPNLTSQQIRDILRSSADKIGPVPYTNGWNPYYGAGRVNASNAVAQAWASSCLGVPILVTSLADSGLGTLRDAIDRLNAAGCPGTISLAITGVIQLALPLPAILPGATITGPGTNQLTLNGGGLHSLFYFASGTTNKLSGLRLANAFSFNTGSGVANLGRTVLENCAFSNCLTLQSFGGAVANFSGTSALFVTNCVFVNNTVRGGAGEDRGAGRNGGAGGGGAGMGGAIYSEGVQLVVHGCAFRGNTAAGGNGGNGDGNSFSNDSGGHGGFPNRGDGGAPGEPGGAAGFGGGGGGGAGAGFFGYNGGAGGYGGGGGGGGALGGGGSGGVGGTAGLYGGAGGPALFSHAGGGGGGAGLGGAIFTRSGAVTIVNCSFTGNLATNGTGGVGSFGAGNGASGGGAGGAIFNLDARIVAQNLSFNGNSATTGSSHVEAPILVTTLADDGPGSLRRAIDNAALRPTTEAITFTTNLSGGVIRLTSSPLLISNLAAPLIISADNLPGGVALSGENLRRAFHVTVGSSLTLHSMTLSNCVCGGVAGTDGGAIWSLGDLNLIRCSLVNNSAPIGDGGALKSAAGTLTVDGCTFLANGAKTSGGAVSSVGNLTVRNSTLVRNIATNDYGGAIYVTQSATLRHCTIVSNAAGQTGGGAFFGTSPSPRLLSHCIVTDNSAPKAPEISLNGASAFFNAVGSSDALANGVNGNLVGTVNSPLNPLLGSLQYYGGSTLTMHPLPGSPVLEAGDPGFSGAGLTDQRGWPRVSLSRVDIGAVEYAPGAGSSVRFDGVNDFLILSNAALDLPTDEITVEFWERVESVRDQFSFILFPDVPANRFSFSSIRANSTTYWDFGDLFNGGRVAYGTPPGTVNQWTHWTLVSTRAGNAMRVYRNGVLDSASATNRAFVRAPAALVLGARLEGAGEYFKGEIDEFRIWSVARSTAEIQADINSGLCPPQTNLWLYWKFNEPNGAVILDHSGHGRHGFLSNGATRAVSFAPLLPAGVAQVVRVSPTQVRVTWTPERGCLQSAPEVTGPWNDVPGATNGQVIVINPTRQFFRLTQ